MSINISYLRAGVFAAVTLLTFVNASAPYAPDIAKSIAMVLQSIVGAAAMLCAVLVARRAVGVARWWRLLVIAAMASWLVGELLWWSSGATDAAPAAGVVAYFLPPVLSLAAMVLLGRAGGALRRRPHGPTHPSRIVAVLDGLVAASAFAILVFMAGLGAVSGAALPRSQNTTVVIAYSLLELVVVVMAVLMAVAYRRGQPYRANYLLLAGGVVLIAASDRLVAYLRTVSVTHADLWGGVGAILGPLMICFALLPTQSSTGRSKSEDLMDWVQALVPYVGFLGVIVVLTSTC